MDLPFQHTYKINDTYKKKVAYFCMEFGIHQALKTYAGGLGFLAGSHMRSAFELGQPMIGIGILWKHGYYDQVRKQDQTMDILFQEKVYGFLIETNIKLGV
jgi:starch phosphorylase